MLRTSNLAAYCIGHALIDAVCLTLACQQQMELVTAILTYNVIAFGGQVLIGWLSDIIQRPALFAAAGCFMLALASLIPSASLWIIVLAGFSNAVFHVGAGTVALNITPRRAAAPGIFVSFGAVGLFAGSLNIKMALVGNEFMAILLVAMGLVVAAIKGPAINYHKESIRVPAATFLCVALLNVAILIRSVVGFHYVLPAGAPLWAAAALTLAVFFGKGTGGFLADVIGWRAIGVGGLLLSVPLLVFSSASIGFLLAGVLLINLTMAITLTATSNALPGRPGFSFGLTCGSLILGYGVVGGYAFPEWAFWCAIVGAAGALYFGLRTRCET